MSTADFRSFIDPDKVPRLTKDQCRMSLDAYPPFLEPLLGVWSPLSKEPLLGITADGVLATGLYGLRSEASPVAAAAHAATTWLAGLKAEHREKVLFPVDSDLWRHWQNTPLLLRDPQIELVDLPMAQRRKALEVVRTSLSPTGFERTSKVMENNLFLGRLVTMTDVLNEWAFSLSIFGVPSTSAPWGWQLFGHHLALNCLFIGDQMVLSPVFMGVEPDDHEGLANRRMFEAHEDQALRVMRSFTDSERSRAVLYSSMRASEQPAGRFHPDDGRQVGGAFQDNRLVPYEGLAVADLDAGQRRELLALADLFISNMPDGPAAARMQEIERYFDRTHFAWIGQANDIDPFYFRIHSPVALIEFDHHSGIFLANEDPARFHVHTIVRSPNAGDYGLDLLKQHYAAGGHEPHHHHHDRADGAHSHDDGKSFHRHD